ncbi:LPS export ABC transporter permease LptF [Aestuariirhabdus litorea]|uniref:Lipopolysaccharide export system permease protein LptF n=1 Tax=Aestuariirhabdus litorea TaxID=2528527 RepID=A0A3P3VUM7_9GAMM|nr:LPS export ABC transporter permease LptF [Aestuariirhabdus litorea]RRJ85326.1 LPS export ABC transporter permease LptF [Aestuariirhabdus litorea]RWW98548.1 LPS export ABC transporter permease LptF [Endozoicomonadaceae bacterium GTF-13]
MIIFRYLAKEVMLAFSAVAAVLLLIILSARFIYYLSRAASGRMNSDYLFALMGYQIPGFLLLLLPLAIFMGILLAYGRLYVDNEMTVLRACGMSSRRLMAYTMMPGLLVASLVAALSFSVAPWSAKNTEWILEKQKTLTEFDMLLPGRFMEADDRVTYTEALSDDLKTMDRVFIAHFDARDPRGRLTLLLAERGDQRLMEGTGSRYLELHDGYRYDLIPGDTDVRAIQYDTYGVKLPRNDKEIEISEVKALSTPRLYNGDREQTGELLWRISLPVMVPILVLLAIPLSRVNPRQGRYMRLLPAVVLYLLYLGGLLASSSAVASGRLDASLAMWPLHLFFLLLGLGLGWGGELLARLRFPGRALKGAAS